MSLVHALAAVSLPLVAGVRRYRREGGESLEGRIACEHEKDCEVSLWCNDASYEDWCRINGEAGNCPAPYCRPAQASTPSPSTTTAPVPTPSPSPGPTSPPTPTPVTPTPTPVPGTCGQKKEPPAPWTQDVGISIVNGRPAPECAWPWQVHLGGCGGTLIAPQWVLSAAHCATGGFPPRTAYAGLHNRSVTSQGQRRTVIAWILHPDVRNPNKWSNDLLLLKLDSPFELNECVNTACLPTVPPQVGAKCWISGWGNLEFQLQPPPEILQEVDVHIKSNADCRDAYASISPVDETMICANGMRDGAISDACQGDSGGPLVCEEGGQWFVHGATSWGRGCADASYPGVWALVTHSLEWIKQTAGL